MNSKVDEYLSHAKKWQPEMTKLRSILLECDLVETFKWRQPCYCYGKSNLLIIGSLKESCILSFFKGSLLDDAHGLLVKPGENSQAARYIKFTSVDEINKLEGVLKNYIFEAVEVEKAGLKVDFKEKNALIFPEELKAKWKEMPEFQNAFEKLTPGKQRGYNLYFTAPKQSKTRSSRIEQNVQKIIDGHGFHDCTCGLSNRMPRCDGSHKNIIDE